MVSFNTLYEPIIITSGLLLLICCYLSGFIIYEYYTLVCYQFAIWDYFGDVFTQDIQYKDPVSFVKKY